MDSTLVRVHFGTSRARKNPQQIRCLCHEAKGIVGHLPCKLLWTVWHFLLHGSQVTCKVTGKGKLRNGLEQFCMYKYIETSNLRLFFPCVTSSLCHWSWSNSIEYQLFCHVLYTTQLFLSLVRCMD